MGEAGSISWARALTWRLRRHHLIERAAPADFLRVASDLCGLHAQLMSSAELSLWARTDQLDRAVVDDALWQRRSLIKLWATRGTLHLLPAAEFGLWLAALGTYTHYGNSDPAMEVLAGAVSLALDGRILTREELAGEVERLTGNPTLGEWVRFSWGSYLKAATFRGLLCFGPGQGGRIRFAAPKDWVPDLAKPDPSEALRTLTRRFLRAYAPLTAADLGHWWIGSRPAFGRRLLAALGDEVREIDIEGQPVWVLASDIEEMAQTKPRDVARLLPAFDPWTIGASRANPVLLDPAHKPRVYRNQGWISPVILVNGRMVGVWKHERKGRQLAVQLDPFDTLPAWAITQIEVEVTRLAAFFDADLTLR